MAFHSKVLDKKKIFTSIKHKNSIFKACLGHYYSLKQKKTTFSAK